MADKLNLKITSDTPMAVFPLSTWIVSSALLILYIMWSRQIIKQPVFSAELVYHVGPVQCLIVYCFGYSIQEIHDQFTLNGVVNDGGSINQVHKNKSHNWQRYQDLFCWSCNPTNQNKEIMKLNKHCNISLLEFIGPVYLNFRVPIFECPQVWHS